MSPYRLTPEAVEERLDELNAIVKAHGEPVSFRTTNPKVLRYRINEALAAARHLKVEPYASLHVTLRVRPPYVHAVPRVASVLDVEVVKEATLLTTPEGHVFNESKSEFEVVQITLQNPALLELHFPNFSGNVAAVRSWSEARGYDILTEPVLILKRRSVE